MRQPRQAIVFPFRITTAGPGNASSSDPTTDAGRARRAEPKETENLVTATRPETTEESGLTGGSPVYRLHMMSGVHRTCFAASAHTSSVLYAAATVPGAAQEWAAGFDGSGPDQALVLSHS